MPKTERQKPFEAVHLHAHSAACIEFCQIRTPVHSTRALSDEGNQQIETCRIEERRRDQSSYGTYLTEISTILEIAVLPACFQPEALHKGRTRVSILLAELKITGRKAALYKHKHHPTLSCRSKFRRRWRRRHCHYSPSARVVLCLHKARPKFAISTDYSKLTVIKAMLTYKDSRPSRRLKEASSKHHTNLASIHSRERWHN